MSSGALQDQSVLLAAAVCRCICVYIYIYIYMHTDMYTHINNNIGLVGLLGVSLHDAGVGFMAWI